MKLCRHRIIPCSPRILILFGLAFVLVLGLLGALRLAQTTLAPHPLAQFETSRWQHAGSSNASYPTRLDMLDDLTKRYPLRGMSKTEVEILLGPSEISFDGWDLAYWLGPEPSMFSVDTAWFVLRLGDNEQVVTYQMITD